jgi:hypothetical protein
MSFPAESLAACAQAARCFVFCSGAGGVGKTRLRGLAWRGRCMFLRPEINAPGTARACKP